MSSPQRNLTVLEAARRGSQDAPLASPLSAVHSVYSHSMYSESSDNTSASSVDDVSYHRALRPGVYVPTVAFFDKQTEDVDVETTTKHAVRLARSGVAGLTTQGSNGEAVHLSHPERNLITKTTRNALDQAGFYDMPVVVGCGAQSTRETIKLCQEALQSGGDYALVLPPSYYKPILSMELIMQFFREVADASPIPILIYNYPAAAAGIDLDSDIITKLAKHPNIMGCKLTCGNTGKLGRIASATDATTQVDPGSGFMCMGGSADFTLQMLVVGGSGVICGVGNIAPKACVEIFKLYEAGKLAKARRMQEVVARGDWAAISGGIIGTKSALETYFGYGGYGRKPLPRPTKQDEANYAQSFRELVEMEKSLS